MSTVAVNDNGASSVQEQVGEKTLDAGDFYRVSNHSATIVWYGGVVETHSDYVRVCLTVERDRQCMPQHHRIWRCAEQRQQQRIKVWDSSRMQQIFLEVDFNFNTEWITLRLAS